MKEVYMRQLIEQVRQYVPEWLYRQLHAYALPRAGAQARWEEPQISPFEKMALAEMRPSMLQRVNDSELRMAWLRLNQWYKAAKRRRQAVEDFVNAAVWVIDELKRRGIKVDENNELYQEASKLAKSADPIQWDKLPDYLVVVPDFVCLVGSMAKGGATDESDVDILFRAELTEDLGHFKVQTENVWLPVRNAVGKDKQLHIIDSPQGPHDTYIPIYDLVLRRKDKPTKRVIKASGFRIDLGCGTNKPEGYIGVDKSENSDADIIWDLEEGLPFADDSADVIRAYHVLEHISDPDFIMREIWRVLKPGGVFEFEVPSTKGEGAFAHPDHKSFWNKSSFVFWTNPDYVDDRPLFEVVELKEFGKGDTVYVAGKLRKPANVVKAIAPFDRFVPPKPQMAGYTEFFTIEQLWDWAKDRMPVLVEPKWNGFRVIAERKGDRIRLWSEGKPHEDISGRVPQIVEVLKRIPGDWILDCDLGIERNGKRLPRPELMKLNRQQVEFAENEIPVLTVFDVPYHNKSWTDAPLKERRAKLERIARNHFDDKYVKLSPAKVANNKDELEAAVKWAYKFDHSEGAMVKDMESFYTERAINGWSKIKKVAELKVKVLGVKRVKGGGYNYRGGLLLSDTENWQNVVELGGKKYVDLGWSFNTDVKAKVGDVITVEVLELIPQKDNTLVWLGARVMDVDKERKEPYSTMQAQIIARSAGVLQKAAKEPGGEGGEAPAERFWEENWWKLYPKDGKGKFTYHHHWRGLTEDELDLTDRQLLQTDHSVHGDLRFEGNQELWGFTVFLGDTEDLRKLRTGDKLFELGPDGKIRCSPKPAQPLGWLDVGKDEPVITRPGEVGATSQKYAKFFVADSGTYQMGVWHRHLVEVFLDGKHLKGRLLIQSVPVGGGKRVWMLSRPENQTPIAEQRKLEEVLAELKAKGHKWLVWAKPGEKPVLYDVKTGKPAMSKSYDVVIKGVEKQLVYGVVLEPDTVDAQGEKASAEEIEKACHAFMAKRVIGLEHNKEAPAELVENYIAPVDFEINGEKVKKGSWVIGVKVHSRSIWEKIKKGEITGFSVAGYARKERGG